MCAHIHTRTSADDDCLHFVRFLLLLLYLTVGSVRFVLGCIFVKFYIRSLHAAKPQNISEQASVCDFLIVWRMWNENDAILKCFSRCHAQSMWTVCTFYLSHVMLFFSIWIHLFFVCSHHRSNLFRLYISFLVFIFLFFSCENTFKKMKTKFVWSFAFAAVAALLLCWHILMSLGDSQVAPHINQTATKKNTQQRIPNVRKKMVNNRAYTKLKSEHIWN